MATINTSDESRYIVTENKAKLREKIRKAIKDKDLFITVVCVKKSACFENNQSEKVEIKSISITS